MRELLSTHVHSPSLEEVREAGNGKKALRLFKLLPVITSSWIFMSEKDGLETIWPLTHEVLGVKIIAMRGNTETLALRAGARVLGVPMQPILVDE